jgi:hypothetical protein
MASITKLPRKPRPLRKTYQPNAPYTVVRQDQEDGSITYEIFDERPDTYRFVCGISEYDQDAHAKWQAEQIARGLNMLVQYGMEQLPIFKDEV